MEAVSSGARSLPLAMRTTAVTMHYTTSRGPAPVKKSFYIEDPDCD